MSGRTLDESARRALERARGEAERLGHDAIGAEHILLGLLHEGGAAADAFAARGVPPEVAEERLQAVRRPNRGRPPPHELQYTSHAKRLIELATREARREGRALNAEHLLRAAFQEPRGSLAKLLARAPTPAGDAGGSRGGAAPPGASGGPPGARTPGPRRADPHAAGRRRFRFSWRAALLAAVPASVVLAALHQPPVLVFGLACLGVLPLAGYMGEATEHLAAKSGPTVGGLLNATFGNAAELIIALAALEAGLVDLVKASITGSILGNLLLILGLALVVSGVDRRSVRFNRTTAGMSAAMLTLAVIGLVFPALFHALHPERAARAADLQMSEGVAGVLIATYGFSLLFSLKTHRRMFAPERHAVEGPLWGTGKALAVLGAATAGVAVESEILVHATEAVTRDLGLSQVFLGLVIIPLIGNAAEHGAAVVLARKGQMDLALQIALGSSTQIALLVGPVLVFAGLLLGQGMNLVFRPFEVLALFLATVVSAILTLDGESHWFEGVQLLAVYAMVALAAFFL